MLFRSQWQVQTKTELFLADVLVVAAGSSPKAWDLAKSLDHHVIAPVPSLFTFNIKDKRIIDLLGLSVPNASVSIVGTNLESSGPLLITHWGMSCPAIVKVSAFGALIVTDKNYQ